MRCHATGEVSKAYVEALAPDDWRRGSQVFPKSRPRHWRIDFTVLPHQTARE